MEGRSDGDTANGSIILDTPKMEEQGGNQEIRKENGSQKKCADVQRVH